MGIQFRVEHSVACPGPGVPGCLGTQKMPYTLGLEAEMLPDYPCLPKSGLGQKCQSPFDIFILLNFKVESRERFTQRGHVEKRRK